MQSHKNFGAFGIQAVVWWGSSWSLPSAHRNWIIEKYAPSFLGQREAAMSVLFLHILPADCFQISLSVCFLMSCPPWTSCLIILTSSLWGRPSIFPPLTLDSLGTNKRPEILMGIGFLPGPSVVPKPLSWHELVLYWPLFYLFVEGPWWLLHAPLEKEMATHSSILAWRIRWLEELGRLQSMGSQRVGRDWATSLHFTSLL